MIELLNPITCIKCGKRLVKGDKVVIHSDGRLWCSPCYPERPGEWAEQEGAAPLAAGPSNPSTWEGCDMTDRTEDPSLLPPTDEREVLSDIVWRTTPQSEPITVADCDRVADAILAEGFARQQQPGTERDVAFDCIEQTIQSIGTQEHEGLPQEAWVIDYAGIYRKAVKRSGRQSPPAAPPKEGV
jgi:hypothetical protein